MTALTQSVAIGDNQITVDTAFADGSFPGYVKIDSELLAVGGAEWRNSKLLTLSKPATATHSNGATVTYAGNPFDADFLSATGGGGGAIAVTDGTTTVPAATSIEVVGGTVTDQGGGVAGVVVATRLLGPFRVNFDDAEIDDDGVAVATIDDGLVIIKAWVVGITPFDAGSGPNPSGTDCYITMGPGSGSIAIYTPNFAISGNAGDEGSADEAVNHKSWIVQAGGQPLTVQVYPPSGTWVAGALDVYALIAEPA